METFKNIGRIEEIAGVFVKYGFGYIVDRFNLPLKKRHPPEEHRLSRAERLRMAFEELGPTFVKFGQLLSLRIDLLPDDVTTELKRLQDTVPPFPVKDVKAAITEELGSPVEVLYGTFSEGPLAAASIGQVHHATLKDGSEVIVKVQRPGIEETIREDLSIMAGLARLLERYVHESRRFDPVGLVEEFERVITRELDFTLEGRNGERFKRNFEGDERVHVPEVYMELTGKKVLTTAFSSGRKISEFTAAETAYRQELARRVNAIFLKQIHEDGFFHADPHPGNIFVMEDGSICFHDFGIVGELDGKTMEDLADLFFAFIERDMDGIADAYTSMGMIDVEIDREAFKRDIGDFIGSYYTRSMKEFSFAEVMRNLILIGKQYDIKVKREFLLLGKTLMTVESLVRSLDPEFNLIENIRPYATTLLLRRFAPKMSRSDIYKALRDLSRLSKTLPSDTARFIKNISEKGLELKLKHEKLESLEAHIDKASNRLSFSLIIAAIIVGSSIIMQIHIGPSYDGIPLLGMAGYIVALVLGLRLVWSIYRSGRL